MSLDLEKLKSDIMASGQLADFLEEVGATTGLFNCSTEKVLTEGAYGNLYRRQMVVKERFAQVEGHQHHYDHMTYLIRGKVIMTTWKEGTDGKKHPGTSVEKEFQAPSAILIRKNNFHKFTALTDDAILECVYAIRDSKTGEFSESFDGSLHPYT